jgi:selenocysteine lyase/cysteine desulfurase
MHLTNQKEQKLARRLFDEISSIKNLTIIGPDFDQSERAPTISFIHDNLSAREVCHILAQHNITAWNGHFYAKKAIEILGLEEKGGVTRLGISMYNNDEDIDKVIHVLKSI